MAVEEVKTHQELHGKEAPVGYQWDAGNTPPRDKSPGRWTVRRDREHWVVLFHSFIYNPPQSFVYNPPRHAGPDYIITTFPPTEEGERAAKKMALRLVDASWGRR